MYRPWERSDRGPRVLASRVTRTRILVVCEGEKTEPNYFKSFPCADVIDLQVKGTGYNTDRLVEEAIRLRNSAADQAKPFNQVWCVFDRDSFTAQSFNRALQLATNEKIFAAVTNEAFELWYLLHFNFNDAAISRTTYGERLTKCLGRRYQKNSSEMYNLVQSLQPNAIKNAKTLLSRYSPWNPESANPSTNVHILVQRLNDLAE